MAKTFEELNNPKGDPKTVLIIDALNLAFRYKPRPKTKDADIPEQKPFTLDYIGVVESLAKSYNAGKIIMACDGGYDYRIKLSPDYKGARRLKYADATEKENKAFQDFLDEFNNTMEYITTKKTAWLTLKYKGVEADDIAAYITNKSKQWDITVWLASSDKDWNLLIDDNVSQFSYVTRKEYTKDNWNEHYEFSVEDYISIKCLQGDSGDSVKGVEGIGPKRAQQLVEQYGSALDIYDALPINSKYAYIKKLNESANLIILNYRLMDLRTFCEEAIGEENLQDLHKKVEDFLGG
jgi:DNA polymerase-1